MEQQNKPDYGQFSSTPFMYFFNRHFLFRQALVLGAAILLFVLFIESFSLKPTPASEEVTAADEQQLPLHYPQKDEQAGDPTISARGYAVMYYHPEGLVRELAGASVNTPFPIASITKIMTAIVATELFPPERMFTITNASLNGQSPSGHFSVGDWYSFDQLIHALLIESNNDAARTFAAAYGRADFVAAMNHKAAELGLMQTVYYNPTGLDPEEEYEPVSRSSPKDVAALMNVFKTTYPDLFSISGTPDFVVRDPEGVARYLSTTTNELLTQPPELKILGGKTGFTLRALENLVVVTETPSGEGYLIHIVLGSPDRFGNMRELINWTADSFSW